MTNSGIQEKAIETMIAINSAIQKIRIYPPATASSSASEAYQNILEIFEKEDVFSIEKGEKAFFVCGQLLTEKDQNKIQVLAFLDLLINFDIKHIAFKKGLDQEELTAFLQILSKGLENSEKHGGLQSLVTKENFSHIRLSQKTERLTKETFLPLMRTLDDILEGEDKDKVCQILADAVAHKDDDLISMILTQKADSDFGKTFLDYIIQKIDDEKFEKILEKLRRICSDTASQNNDIKDTETDSAQQIYQKMMNSDKGKRARKKDEQGKNVLREKLNSMLKGEKNVFDDTQFTDFLPDAVDEFFEKENKKAAHAILSRLEEYLISDDPVLRDKISQILSKICEKLIAEKRLNNLYKLSHKLIQWIKLEISPTPAYEQICTHLQILAQILIQRNRLAECSHILKTFNAIYCGKIKKNETIQVLMGSALKGIAAADIIEPVLKEFETNKHNRRKESADKLILLGAASVDHLLELLKESNDKSERSRLLRIISNMGYAAIPSITIQIQQEGPWYYIRNLILLLGRIGNKNHLLILRPFLDYENTRIKREALNSICSIGGKEGEDILLSALPSADDLFKINIVGALGAMRCQAAVPHFQKLLESMSQVSSEIRDELAKKICIALGTIGSHDAIVALTEIFEQKNKKLLGKKVYNEKIKDFATEALTMKSDTKGKIISAKSSA